MSKSIVTTIKPTAGLFVSFKPRSKEGQAEKLEIFASYEMPAEIANLHDGALRTFAFRSYGAYVLECLKDAVKDSRQEFTHSLESAYEPAAREFLITRKDLESWFDSFAAGIIAAAISAKTSLHIDSPKVVKKVIAYKEIMLAIASRSLMLQDQIDTALRVMALIDESGKQHAYTDNVLTGIVRKQDKLNAAATGTDEDEEDIDF